MNLKLLACEVITREICYCVARAPHAVTPSFTPKDKHNQPGELQRFLQDQIGAASEEETRYDAILLGYGLCGNATLGLVARDIPLVVPRAHDCTTLFLGSKELFKTYFGANPSQSWASVGYSERGKSVLSDSAMRHWLGDGGADENYQALVEQYGEENAQYLMDAMRPAKDTGFIYYLDIPETREPAVAERIRKEAERSGAELRALQGSIRLIDMLVSGHWPEDEFLVVPPGQKLTAVYDYDEVIRAEPVCKNQVE